MYQERKKNIIDGLKKGRNEKSKYGQRKILKWIILRRKRKKIFK